MSVSNLFKNGNRPNILIIITDQERAIQHWPDSFSKEHLPAMERLKKHGLDFNHHYTNATMCSPSRSTLLTSRYPVLTGVTRTGSPGPPRQLPTDIPNLATVLKEAGYAKVEWHGKWHVGRTPAEYGFEGWQPPDAGNYLSVNETLGGGTPDNDGRFLKNLCSSLDKYREHKDNKDDNTLEQQEQQPEDPKQTETEEENIPPENGDDSDSSQSSSSLAAAAAAAPPLPYSEPFCIVASFVNPHDVYVAQHGPAKGYVEEDLQRLKVPLPSNYMEDTDENGKPRAHGQMSSRYVPFECTHQEYVNFYAYLHTVVDAQIGQLLDKVDDCGFTENTLIFRTADHGEQGLSHSLVEKFFNCYQESLRIPMVVSNPIAFPEPQTTDALSSHLDLLPTLAGLMGHTQKFKTMQGTDLTQVLDNPQITTTVTVKSLKLPSDDESDTGEEDKEKNEDDENNGDHEISKKPNEKKREIVTREETFPGIQKSIHFTYDDIAFPGAPSTIRCLHKGTMKYAVYFAPNGRDTDWELYDLKTDPLEDNNLAGKPEYKELQWQLEQELFETMLEKRTMPRAFRWPPRPTRYSVGFNHPPGMKLDAPKGGGRAPRREEEEEEEDPIQYYKFKDEGEFVSVALGMDEIGTKCTEDDIELIVTPPDSQSGEVVVIIVKNFLPDTITLSFGKPKASIKDAVVVLSENGIVVKLTKEDPSVKWESFQE